MLPSITAFKMIAKSNKENFSSLGHSLDDLSKKFGYKDYNAIKPKLTNDYTYFNKEDIPLLKYFGFETDETDKRLKKISDAFLSEFKILEIPDDFTEENIEQFVEPFIQKMFYFADKGIEKKYKDYEEFYIEEIFAYPGAWYHHKRCYYEYLLYKDERYSVIAKIFLKKYGKEI